MRGIDVSHYQGDVDWNRVRAAGIDFAYIKATEGGDFTDPGYHALVSGARAAGMRIGFYHYFTFCTDGAAQARQFLSVTSGPRPGDLPPVVDLEFGGNCSRVPTTDELDRQFAAFEEPVRKVYGRSPMLYLTADFAARYLDTSLNPAASLRGKERWVRNILTEPKGGCGRWSFWQYANRGWVDGIQKPVDLDAFCGTRDAFERALLTPT